VAFTTDSDKAILEQLPENVKEKLLKDFMHKDFL